MMKAGMRDIDDIEDAERDRNADCHGGVEAAEQDAGDQRIDEKLDGKIHSGPPVNRPARYADRVTS